MAIHRVTAQWSGFPGAPGYSNFYFAGDGTTEGDAQASAARVRTFFDAITNRLPTGVSIQVEPEVASIDEASGNMTGIVAIDPVLPVSGVGTGGFSGPSGAVVNWLTTEFINGRMVRGRTFLVPLAASSYEDDGTLTTNALTGLRTAATALIGDLSDAGLMVWRRPIGGAGGSANLVRSAQVPDLAAVLRSRRD